MDATATGIYFFLITEGCTFLDGTPKKAVVAGFYEETPNNEVCPVCGLPRDNSKKEAHSLSHCNSAVLGVESIVVSCAPYDFSCEHKAGENSNPFAKCEELCQLTGKDFCGSREVDATPSGIVL